MFTVEKVYQFLAIDDEGRLCRVVPESDCKHLHKNFLNQIYNTSLNTSLGNFSVAVGSGQVGRLLLASALASLMISYI